MSMLRTFVQAGRRVTVHTARRTLLTMATPRAHLMRECRAPLVARFSTKTKAGDEELSTFLKDEIEAEKRSRKQNSPPQVAGFETKLDGSDVTLTRRFQDETITVTFNVNHTVDAEDGAELPQEGQDSGSMLSKPNFDVTIEKAGQKILLSCTFAEDQTDQQQEYDDLFQIVEFGMYSGEEFGDQDYSVSGDIMDGQLYDLLMNLLEERGITNEFAEQVVEFATSYEHGLYINLLEKLKGFVSK